MIVRILQLSSDEFRLLCKVTAALWIARIGIWILPFQASHRLVTTRLAPSVTERTNDDISVRQITTMIARGKRVVPRANCLVQAYVGLVFLRRAGHEAELRIGVQRSAEQQFAAHAWVECEGRVVVGGAQSTSFMPLPLVATPRV